MAALSLGLMRERIGSPNKTRVELHNLNTVNYLCDYNKRRRRRLEISIDEPFPEQRPSSIYHSQECRKRSQSESGNYLINNPDTNQSQIAEEFGVTRARISQLIKINNNLPNNFITILAESKDPILLRRFQAKGF